VCHYAPALPILKLGNFVIFVELYKFVNYSDNELIPYKRYELQIFLPFCRLPFTVIVSFDEQNLYILMSPIYLFLKKTFVLVLLVLFPGNYCKIQCHEAFLFSSRSFTVLGLMIGI
jgi:hypothetical protein